MRPSSGLSILALAAGFVLAAPKAAEAQSRPPPGSYQSRCTDIRMEGQFLKAWCRGQRGGGESSLNVLSCRTDIGVDASGGLVCGGGADWGDGNPGPLPPPPPRPRPPPGGYDPPGGGYEPPYGNGRWSATLYERRGYRGRSIEVSGETRNLDKVGLNDRVRSIRFNRRSGPWQICSDASFKGRCTIIRGSIDDTAQIGMRDAISSLRPTR